MAPQIPDLVLLNASALDLTNYNEGWWTKYSWSDGTPTAEVMDSGTGVFLPITNNPATGYQLVVPATNHLRCLKVYVGLLFARVGNNPSCYLTGRPIDLMDGKSYHLDHIGPKNKGGQNSLDNCNIACKDANQAKGNLLYDEFIIFCEEVLRFHQQNKDNI